MPRLGILQTGEAMSDMFVVRVGKGRPVLVMHGGLGLDHTYLRPYLDQLGEQCELIYFDIRGNGRSPRPADLSTLNHDTWSDDAAQLINDLGLSKPVVLGHSYGGFLAQSFALRHPTMLSGLVLSNTAPALDYPEVILANAQRKALPGQMSVVMQTLAQPAASDADFQNSWNGIVSLYFKYWDTTHGRAFDAATHYSGDGYNAGAKCLAFFNTMNRLKEIRTPSLILAGADDWITPVKEGATRLKEGIVGAVLEVFENSGHFPFIEESVRYRQVLGAWLK